MDLPQQKLFGTDGVRGVAGELLTAELAVALGIAATRECTGGPAAGARPARHARVGPDAGVGDRRRNRSGRWRRARRRRVADARRLHPRPPPGARPRSGDLRVAQPVARQRDQVLRPRRAQARRRRTRRGSRRSSVPGSLRSRARGKPGSGRFTSFTAASTTICASSPTPSASISRAGGSCSIARTAPPTARRRRSSRAWAPTWMRSPRSPTGATSTTAADRRIPRRWRRASSTRAPRSASPSTVTGTASSPSTRRA